MDAPPTFGQLLRRARRAAGLTQEALAERAGISARAVIDLERGVNRSPRRDTLELLAVALNLTPEEHAHWERLRRRLSLRASKSTATKVAPKHDLTPTNLPAEFDELIGRDADRSALGELLATKRLVTLTGPGGIGKTRLAITVGRDALAMFPAGVYVVDLAPVSDVAMVVPAIAQVLSVRETAGQSMLTGVMARIGSGRMLLVLDNVEHVSDAATIVRDLLAACSQLVLLTTSRVRLRLRGEQVYPVPALPTPAVADIVTAATLPDVAATALFLQRAREVKPDLVVSDRDAPVVAAICRCLDGIPLAIELAAARCRVLSLPALLDRLTSALDVLAGGPRDVPERHQTLRETLAWSETLLSSAEQAMFRHLSVFAGGWTLEAAEAVTSDIAGDVLDCLTALIDHSLVSQLDQPDGTMRFRFLEPIRNYAREQLDRAGETGSAQERHATWFLAFAEERDDVFATAGSMRYAWLDHLATEYDNLRQALYWCIEQSATEPLLRLSAALVWFWSIRNHLSEGRTWLGRALSLTADTSSAARAIALLGLGSLASDQGDWQAATPALAASLTLFRERDDRRGIIAVLNNQGVVAAQQGDRAAAEALFTAALDQARELGNQPIIGELLNNLGVMRVQAGDVDQARVLYEESLAHHRSMGLRHHESRVLLNLGWIALDQGRWADAEPLVADALVIARTFQDPSSTIEALNVRGALALHQAQLPVAQAALLESLTLSRHIAYPDGAAYALELLAMVAVERGLIPLGVQVFAAAATLRETAGVPNNPQDAARTAQACDAAHALVDDAIFSSAWDSGATLSLDAAIALAQTLEDEDVDALRSSSNTA